jgi:hypothetical protein
MSARRYATGAHRRSAAGDDWYPTPPWATRALLEHPALAGVEGMTCWEPACGDGRMVRVLEEGFGRALASDIHPRGCGVRADFLSDPPPGGRAVDWVVTNPPYTLAEEFALRALTVAREGVALLVRTQWLEGVARHRRIWDAPHPWRPRVVLVFAERVAMVRGRCLRRASTATSYMWVIWRHTWPEPTGAPVVHWVPPGTRARLERPGDYDDDPESCQ